MSPPNPAHAKTDLFSHFGLRALPFTRELSVGDRFALPTLEEALESIRAMVERKQSAALVGAAGTGKTVLLRALSKSLPEARFRVHYVKVTGLSKRDFCRELCLVVGARPVGAYNSLVRQLQERMAALLDEDSLQPVLIIDEAHDMRPEVLSALRVLTNFDMDSRLVVSVVLSGQLELRQLLRRPELEAIGQRMAHWTSLRLLGRDETTAYVMHRLSLVGAQPDVFHPTALSALYISAGGNLRATNHLALKAMEEACAAGHTTVTADHVAAALPKVRA